MWQALWGRFVATLYIYLRPMIKWIFRRVTGKCELLRIIYQYPAGVTRTKCIEYSLKSSRNPDLKRLTQESDTNVEAAIVLVMKAKNIIPEVHGSFQDMFRPCLVQICGYVCLKRAVESVRQVKYSMENAEHEEKLLKLWSNLMPEEALQSRTGPQWTQIGFQGDNPLTDFRGMGQLGLDQLLYFTIKYKEQARAMLSRSHEPTRGYSLAIVGINMTELVYTLLVKGVLRNHFYGLKSPRPTLEDYHEVYCCVFYEFDKFWFAEKPRDIMDFGKIREKYRKKTIQRLKDKELLVASFQKAESSS